MTLDSALSMTEEVREEQTWAAAGERLVAANLVEKVGAPHLPKLYLSRTRLDLPPDPVLDADCECSCPISHCQYERGRAGRRLT